MPRYLQGASPCWRPLARCALIVALIVCASLPASRAARAAAPAIESLDRFPRATLEIQTTRAVERFDVWLADTPSRSEQGLMFVRSLAPERGMVFPNGGTAQMRMWMKNTYIRLDMLFISPQGEIIYIEHNAAPLSEALITTPAPFASAVQAVIELAGGECAKRHIEPGDQVRLHTSG